MANRFRGFAMMLSTAKNSTRKEGSGRMFSSTAQESPKERMKNTSGDINYEDTDTRTTRNFYLNVSKGASVGLTIGTIYGYFVYGWYPFKGTLEGDRSHKPWGAARDSAGTSLEI
ncbi:hypothetical protein C5167_012865 [Papaver somniferum]|uniref:Uncharacterized protein n=1 Tax=Papaver somniferum TaxID=3469 RepID=A0A4Y7J300_PAPSO|nr:hypothetical protein C5167_012865 [Papaver somniferum]